MNSSLDALFENLSEMVFKYLPQQFNGNFLELIKQKGVYRYEYIDSINYLISVNFLVI